MASLGASPPRTCRPGPLASLLVNGVIGGAGSVLVFLPQILILFFFILALEDSGYLPRAAYLLDRLMGFVGLSGRAFIPLLSSHACAIPGIMATRTIPNWRDRLTTIMIAPLMTCSARLPVYALLIGALIPARARRALQPAGAGDVRAVLRRHRLARSRSRCVMKQFARQAPVLAADARAARLPVAARRQPAAGPVGAREDLPEPRRRHHPRADDRVVVPVQLPGAAARAPPGPPIQYSFAGRLGALLAARVRAASASTGRSRSRWCPASRRAKSRSARSAPCTPCPPRVTTSPRSSQPVIASSWSLATGLCAAGLVRVRAAVPVDAGGGEARNQFVALSADHGRLPVRAGLHRGIHHLPRRRGLGVEFASMLQEILVAVIVTGALLFSVWKLMPARRRLRALLALDAWAARRPAARALA